MTRIPFVVLAVFFATALATPVQSELVAHYSFEEEPAEESGSFYILDDTTRTHRAELKSGVQYVLTGGARGGYLAFDGDDDFVSLPPSLAAAMVDNPPGSNAGDEVDGWTFAAFVKRKSIEDDTEGQQAILAVNPIPNSPDFDENRFLLFINNQLGAKRVGGVWNRIKSDRENKLTGWSRDLDSSGANWTNRYHPSDFEGTSASLVAGGSSFENAEWRHVAVVVRPDVASSTGLQTHYFIDGIRVDSGEQMAHNADFLLREDDRWSLGQDYDKSAYQTSDFLEGGLDEVYLFNHALTDDQIKELSQGGFSLDFVTPQPWASFTIPSSVAPIPIRLRVEDALAKPNRDPGDPIPDSELTINRPSTLTVQVESLRTRDGVLDTPATVVATYNATADHWEFDLNDLPWSTGGNGDSYPVGNFRLTVYQQFDVVKANNPAQTVRTVQLDAQTFFTIFEPSAPPANAAGWQVADRDIDGIEDWQELLLFGDLSVVTNPNDPDLPGAGDPRITAISHQPGSTIDAAALGDPADSPRPVLFTFLVADAANHTISIRNALTDAPVDFDVNSNGGEITVSVHAGNATPTEHISQRYVVALEPTIVGDKRQEYDLYFQVDPVAPVITLDPPAGQISSAAPTSVQLSASEPLSRIEFRTNGEVDWEDITGNAPWTIEITGSTLLEVRAIDVAGNESQTRHLYLNDQAPPPPGYGFSFNATSSGIPIVWQPMSAEVASVGGEYRLYRVISDTSIVDPTDPSVPPALAELYRRYVNSQPPPGDALFYTRQITTDKPQNESTVYVDTELNSRSLVGLRAWYAVSYRTADGRESRTTPLFSVASDPAPAVIAQDYDAIVASTVRYLESIQDENHGSWGQGTDADRVRATCEVLDAFAMLPPGQVLPETVERGLRFLRGTFVDQHEAIARQIDTLQRYGQDPRDLHVRLAFRAHVSSPGGPDARVGWGVHRAYHPDPWHTSLAQLARRGAYFTPPEIPGTNGDAAVKRQLEAAWMEARVNAQDDTNLAVGDGRFGWIPNNRDSVAVSALAYQAMGINRFELFDVSTGPGHWLLNELDPDGEPYNSSGDAKSGFRNNVFDTASALLHLRIDTAGPVTRTHTLVEELRNYLLDHRNFDPSYWADGDPFVTARCLRALIQPKAYLIDTPGMNASSRNQVARALRSRGFLVVAVDAPTFGSSHLFDNAQRNASLIITNSQNDIPFEGVAFLANTPIPVLNLDPQLTDDLGFASGPAVLIEDVETTVLDPSHPLLRDLGTNVGDRINIGSTPDAQLLYTSIPRNTPGTLMTQDMTPPDQPVHASLLAFEAGQPLPNGRTAPGRRIQFPLPRSGVSLNANGFDVLDAAIEWATYRTSHHVR